MEVEYNENWKERLENEIKEACSAYGLDPEDHRIRNFYLRIVRVSFQAILESGNVPMIENELSGSPVERTFTEVAEHFGL